MFGRNACSSPQVPDYVIYKRDTIPVYNLILEQYFETKNISGQGSLFGLKFREGASLNCWRGYQAIYLIENDSLFLKEIINCGGHYNKNSLNQEDSKKRMKEIFKEEFDGDKVFLGWYSGGFSLPNGELLRWDGVFHKIYDKEILIEIDKGKVKHTSDISNYEDDPERINRRYRDTISNVIFKELETIKWKSVDKFDPSEKYLVTIGKNGEVNKVSMPGFKTKAEINEYWEKGEYNYCITTIYNALKNLKFDIVKMQGQPIEEDVYIEIWLGDNGKLENWTD